jgi:DNA-binding response OmpR family regulator
MPKRKILIADDSDVAREYCGSHLDESEFELFFAENGIEAIRVANAQELDVILMDVMMPEMDGVEACRRIKSNQSLKGTSIIMITSVEDLNVLESAFDAGAADYIGKPVQAVELMARLRSVLRLQDEMEARKRHEKELELKNQELERALDEVRTLRGFIPICAWCKKIRNFDGFWLQMERYIERHSYATFSHGICQECAAKALKGYRPRDK